MDSVVLGATQSNLEVVPTLTGAPAWVVPYAPVPGTHGDLHAPSRLPVSADAAALWRGFITAAANRYGPTGSFWEEHPSLPRRPIRSWQIWNEPNFKYFLARPNPADYGRLVEISAQALHGVDPGAKIVLAGLFGSPIEAGWSVHPPQAFTAADFLQRAYEANPRLSASFDAASLHPYSRDFHYLAPQIAELRAVLRRHRDSKKGLWITELGWSSGQPTAANGYNKFEKGPSGQARQLRRAFSLLIENRQRWNLERVFWFSLTDAPGACNFCDGSGLFGPGFKPKPAWWAFMEMARRGSGKASTASGCWPATWCGGGRGEGKDVVGGVG